MHALQSQRTYTNKDHILAYKANLKKFKIIEIMQRMFFDHHKIKPQTTER
jgi:hypothetical protein